jgi:hypothetical protein
MDKQNWNPGSLLGISGQYWKTCTLHAAVKLDIFTTIGDGAMTGKMIAEKIGADTDAVGRLLNALAALTQRVEDLPGLYDIAPSPSSGILVQTGPGSSYRQAGSNPLIFQ